MHIVEVLQQLDSRNIVEFQIKQIQGADTPIDCVLRAATVVKTLTDKFFIIALR